MVILIAVWIGMLWGVIKWIITIVDIMRNRCKDKDCRLGAIVSNICYVVVTGFFSLIVMDIGIFAIIYPILAILGNTVFCMCTTPVPEHTNNDDDHGNDDYGYINH